MKAWLKSAAVGLLACYSALSCAQGAVSILVGGWTANNVLDKAQEVADRVLGTAAQNGSLVISKGARDTQLLIEAARQEMHDELGTQWKNLDSQKISILRELDASTQRIEKLGKQVESIQDAIVLDIDSQISRLPFAHSTPVIRRVEGGTQYFKKSGLYRVTFTSNLVALAPPGSITVTIGGKPVPPEAVNVKPPYSIAVMIPTTSIKFDKDKLLYVPIELHAPVPNDRGWAIWKDKTRNATLASKLELFPINAVTYSLIEWRAVPTVSRNRLEVQKGPDMTVSGCGNDGCNAYHPQCVGVPAGAVPVDYINARDSFSGWGGWGASRVEGTQVCATYWQHSHNVTRNVGFDARYYPVDLVRTAVPVPLVKIEYASPPVTPPPSAVAGTMAIGAMGNEAELGGTYSGFFSDQYASYDLVVKPFTGETIISTPSTTQVGTIAKVSALENSGTFKRITVQFVLPW